MSNLNDFIGIPFKNRGRDRSGLDCWGLVRLVYSERFDIDLPCYSEQYEKVTDMKVSRIASKASKSDEWEKVDNPEFGDVVLLNIMGVPWHVGIFVGNGHVLHIERGINSCIEKTNGLIWNKRIAGYYRHKSRL